MTDNVPRTETVESCMFVRINMKILTRFLVTLFVCMLCCIWGLSCGRVSYPAYYFPGAEVSELPMLGSVTPCSERIPMSFTCLCFDSLSLSLEGTVPKKVLVAVYSDGCSTVDRISINTKIPRAQKCFFLEKLYQGMLHLGWTVAREDFTTDQCFNLKEAKFRHLKTGACCTVDFFADSSVLPQVEKVYFSVSL